MGVELTSKTLGLIGCGNIGSIVAERALGLRMKVVAFDPFLTPERAIELGVEKADLDTLLAKADFITLHTPLTDQTRNILSKENLAKTKKGVRIINCARGGLIDEAALKDALDSGHVAGAALDVFQTEPPAADHPLFGTPNFICTPHLGASTDEAQVNVAIQVAEQLSDYLLTGGITNALNVPSLSAEEAPKLRPYMSLAEKLGSLVGQLAHDNLTTISIEVEGAAAELNLKPITAAVLTGLMRRYSDSVNMVNAPHLARERGLDVREVRHDREGDYHTRPRHRRNRSRRPFGRGDAVRQQRTASRRNVRHQGRGRSRRRHALYRQRGRARLHRSHRQHAGRCGAEHRHLPPRPPRRGGEAVLLLSLDSAMPEPLLWQVCQLPGVKMVKGLKF